MVAFQTVKTNNTENNSSLLVAVAVEGVVVEVFSAHMAIPEIRKKNVHEKLNGIPDKYLKEFIEPRILNIEFELHRY